MIIHALWSHPNRSGRRFRRLSTVALLSVVLAACGGSESETDETTGSTAETSTTASETSVTTDPDSPTGSDEGDPAASTGETAADGAGGSVQDLDRLRDIIDATVARNSARFSLDVTQTLAVVGPNQASMRRTGSFDDEQQIGTGTQQFVGESVASADLPGYAGEELEHRLVDGTYWLLNPLSEPPSWIGYELDAFADLTQADPAVAVDGDLYLRTLSDAVTSITDVAEFADGSEGWTLLVAADDLLPLVVTAGVQQRLVGSGLGPTDLDAPVSLAVDPDGMVVGLIADLDEWWQAVTDQTAGAGGAPVGMVLQFQIGDFDADVEVDTPCAAPEEFVQPDTPPALICEG